MSNNNDVEEKLYFTLSLSSAIKKFVWKKFSDQMNLSILINPRRCLHSFLMLSDLFLENLATGKYVASGMNVGSGKIEEIDREFWKNMRLSKKRDTTISFLFISDTIDRAGLLMYKTAYSNVVISSDAPRQSDLCSKKNTEKPMSNVGRPVKDKWMHEAAIACQIVFKYSYDLNQREFADFLEEAMLHYGIDDSHKRDRLDELCSKIYEYSRKTLPDMKG